MMDRVKNLGFSDKARGYLAVHARDTGYRDNIFWMNLGLGFSDKTRG